MHPDTLAFLDCLFQRCQTGYSPTCLTLTAIHPIENCPTPSRHIPLNRRAELLEALHRLAEANALGWGGYFAVGLRKPGLSRWRRGGTTEVVALPAFYADIDDLAEATRTKLYGARLPPSVIVHSGGGYHAYWLLDEPTADLNRARRVLHGLARAFQGDRLSVAQSLRLPGTHNTKPGRERALCHIVELSNRRYALSDFDPFALELRAASDRRSSPARPTVARTLNPALIAAISSILYRDYAARERQRSAWLAALCPCGHARDSPGAHFAFNPTIGCGHCYGRHGTLRLTELCAVLGIDAAAYGGVYR